MKLFSLSLIALTLFQVSIAQYNYNESTTYPATTDDDYEHQDENNNAGEYNDNWPVANEDELNSDTDAYDYSIDDPFYYSHHSDVSSISVYDNLPISTGRLVILSGLCTLCCIVQSIILISVAICVLPGLKGMRNLRQTSGYRMSNKNNYSPLI